MPIEPAAAASPISKEWPCRARIWLTLTSSAPPRRGARHLTLSRRNPIPSGRRTVRALMAPRPRTRGDTVRVIGSPTVSGVAARTRTVTDRHAPGREALVTAVADAP